MTISYSPPAAPTPTQTPCPSLEISPAASSIAQQLQQTEVDFSRLEAKHWEAIEQKI